MFFSAKHTAIYILFRQTLNVVILFIIRGEELLYYKQQFDKKIESDLEPAPNCMKILRPFTHNIPIKY